MRVRPGAIVLGSALGLLFVLGACGEAPDRTGATGAQADGADAPAAVDRPGETAGPDGPTGAPAADAPAPSTGTSADTPAPFRGTAGIIDEPRPDAQVATLQAVRTGRHDGFDRVTFEFSGEGVPGYHIEYIDRPARQCGSGAAVPLEGDGLLEVRMSPARAHTEEGRVTVADRERAPGLPVLKELKLTCDFEAVVEWVLGVASPNRYRVQELGGPPRLVVDVLH